MALVAQAVSPALIRVHPMPHTRTHIRRHPERDVMERAAPILAAGHVAHVGFVEDGQPFVIPLGYQFDPAQPDRLYLHGSTASRAVQHAASGAPVCITVTLLDGLVYSRTALYHSMNYRSVVCFGRGSRVTDPELQQTHLSRHDLPLLSRPHRRTGL